MKIHPFQIRKRATAYVLHQCLFCLWVFVSRASKFFLITPYKVFSMYMQTYMNEKRFCMVCLLLSLIIEKKDVIHFKQQSMLSMYLLNCYLKKKYLMNMVILSTKYLVTFKRRNNFSSLFVHSTKDGIGLAKSSKERFIFMQRKIQVCNRTIFVRFFPPNICLRSKFKCLTMNGPQ